MTAYICVYKDVCTQGARLFMCVCVHARVCVVWCSVLKGNECLASEKGPSDLNQMAM